jgi:hypothetical protein
MAAKLLDFPEDRSMMRIMTGCFAKTTNDRLVKESKKRIGQIRRERSVVERMPRAAPDLFWIGSESLRGCKGSISMRG